MANTEPGGSSGASPVLSRGLNVSNLIAFGLVSMGPVAAFTMFGFVSTAAEGAILPAYLLGAAGVMLTALSFAQMASVAAQSGSVYGYAKFAIGGVVGFLGGWAMLLDYMLLGALTAVYGALYLASALPQVPSMVFLGMIFAVLLVTGIRGLALSSKFDFGVLLLQLAFCLVFLVLALAATGHDGVASALDYAILPSGAGLAGIMAGAALSVISFLGFDAISTLAEEVTGAHPGRRIGSATLVSVALMLLVFVLVSWLLAVLAAGMSLADPATAAFDILAARMPALATPLAIICGLAVGVGACQACHTGATRLVFAIARDGRLPAGLSAVSPRFRTPLRAMLTTLAVIVAISTIALDRAEVLAGLVSFGALSGFLLVNVSVLVHFGLRQGSRDWLRHWLAPALGALVVLYIMAGIHSLALWLGLGWLAAGAVIFALHRGAKSPVGNAG